MKTGGETGDGLEEGDGSVSPYSEEKETQNRPLPPLS